MSSIFPKTRRPLRVRTLRVAAIALAVVGLILLYLCSTNRDIPKIKIADITQTMNFACVKISGKVTRSAYIFSSGGFVFNIDDGSGQIAVFGGKSQANSIKENGLLPRKGDHVEVVGAIHTSSDSTQKLRILSSEQMKIARKKRKPFPDPEKIEISKIEQPQEGKRVLISGVLKSISIPAPGSRAPYSLTLEENGVTLPIVFWSDVFHEMKEILPVPGTTITAVGKINVYKNSLQLRVFSASDIRIVKEEEK